MTTINVYLNFDGNCEEAFRFYRTVFGGEFGFMGRFSEIPPEEGAPQIPEALAQRIMHVSLPISKETILMGSDILPGYGEPFQPGNNFAISINTGSRTEADRLFGELGRDGAEVMPLGDTFWGAYFGMVKDRFGVHWMVSYETPKS